MTPMRLKLTFVALAVSSGLVALACSRDDGGGGGREGPAPAATTPAPSSPPTNTPSDPPSNTSPSPSTPPSTPPTSTSPPATPPGDAPPEGPISDLFARVNQARGEARSCGGERFEPAPPLRFSGKLGAAAQAHSDDMVARDYFDHTSPDGGGPEERIGAQGYEFSTWGENIAAGQATAEDAMKTWLESPGHCSNIMNPDMKDFGAGLAEGGEYRYYWTQVFAAPGR